MPDAEDTTQWDPATIAVAAGRGGREPGEPVNVGVALTSIYHAGDGPPGYARHHNPTWTALEEVIGALEGGTARCFASGMAAVAAVLGLFDGQATVVAPFDAYGGMRALLDDAAAHQGLHVRTVAIADTAATLAACEDADLLWIESPTNPLLQVADIAALVQGAHRHGALVAVDNTFATPLLQRPLAMDADLVVHSVTKFLSGHADVLLGAVVARDPALVERLDLVRRLSGAIPGPMEAWLALRGIRTLPLRLERGQASAAVLAQRFRQHPGVVRVRYPGLPQDPGHARATAHMRGFGAVLSVEVQGGAAVADAWCERVRIAVHATSLGGVETTMERRTRQAGEAHVPHSLVRISVGCEDVEDLWADLAGALDAATAATG